LEVAEVAVGVEKPVLEGGAADATAVLAAAGDAVVA
jgi:hypothetical protein